METRRTLEKECELPLEVLVWTMVLPSV
jgi:hypothetical protein